MNTKTKNLMQICRLLEANADENLKWRPGFHLSPKTGWMNDPNGLCEYKGEYHIFFQYSPYNTCPGTNFWGHFTTKDFVSYQYHAPALCVDEKFDCHGVYSGSAIVENDKMYLFYTGNVKQCGDGLDYILKGREHNTVIAESEDGFNFTRKQLLMENSDYPEECTCHVRDPKVFKLEGRYYMVLGARRRDDVGEVLVFESIDKYNWKHINTIRTEEKLGFMWECPDLFELDGQWFLSVSPQGVESDGYKYNNVYQSGYFPLYGDFRTECSLGEFTEIDRGFDFYAPQSFLDEDGRRIMIGWLGLPDLDDYYENPTHEMHWMHMLTCPRKLGRRGDRLMQYPVCELEKLRGDCIEVNVNGLAEIKNADVFDMEINSIGSQEISITLRGDCKISYKNRLLTLEFGESGMGRKSRTVKLDALDNLRILADTSSVEIFANGGEEVFSSRYYPDESSVGVIIKAQHIVLLDRCTTDAPLCMKIRLSVSAAERHVMWPRQWQSWVEKAE